MDPHWVDVPEKLKGKERRTTYTIASATGGWLTQGNVDALYYGLKHTRDVEGRIREIGAFCGMSSNIITLFKRILGIKKKLITIDAWGKGFTDENQLAFTGISQRAFHDYARDSYLERVKFFSSDDLPSPIKGFSTDIMDLWAKNETLTDLYGTQIDLGGPIAFAFVDGDHSYEVSKLDFENIDRDLSPGGMILFDDSGVRDKRGSSQTAQEVAASGKYKVISKNPNFLVQKL